MLLKALYGGDFYENSSRSFTVVSFSGFEKNFWYKNREKKKINHIIKIYRMATTKTILLESF